MNDTMDIGVIGLGNFGFSLAKSMHDLGHSVIGVDMDAGRIRRAQDTLEQVYQADATDQIALEQLGFQDLDHVIVSTGKNMEASILVVMNLQEIGIQKIWVKAISEKHEKVLKRLGVDLVVFPEQHVARQMAHRLAVPGLMDYLDLGSDVVTREVTIKEWKGMTLQELDLTNTREVQVVAIKPASKGEYQFVPKAGTVLNTSDTLVLLGQAKNVLKINDY